MAPNVVGDGRRRLIQPGAHPADTLALDDAGHAGQPGRARAPQGLQQHGLGLVALVVGQQDGFRPHLGRHLGQG
jgi:hypothetical protein